MIVIFEPAATPCAPPIPPTMRPPAQMLFTLKFTSISRVVSTETSSMLTAFSLFAMSSYSPVEIS